MAFYTSTTGADERPTLPPIHTLNLPMLSRTTQSNVKYDTHDNLRCAPLPTPRNNSYHGRQVSSSSTHTDVSRTASPSPDSDSDTSPVCSSSNTTKFRLVPCPLETADAVILIPAPDAPQSANYTSRQGKGKGLLLVGPALQYIRHPQRPLAKGARIHPYRIVRGPKTNTDPQRRSSVISITSFPKNV